jgi:hypothetical protein
VASVSASILGYGSAREGASPQASACSYATYAGSALRKNLRKFPLKIPSMSAAE